MYGFMLQSFVSYIILYIFAMHQLALLEGLLIVCWNFKCSRFQKVFVEHLRRLLFLIEEVNIHEKKKTVWLSRHLVHFKMTRIYNLCRKFKNLVFIALLWYSCTRNGAYSVIWYLFWADVALKVFLCELTRLQSSPLFVGAFSWKQHEGHYGWKFQAES